MNNITRLKILLGSIFILSIGFVDSYSKVNNMRTSSDFIQTDGMLLRTPDGNQLLIKGISFGNHVWGNPDTSSWFTHHSTIDFSRVKAMGFNTIRFYTNYGLFESDSNPYSYKQSGFDWLDKNIADAKASGVYLLINMHYPQGGFQSNGAGDALWTNTENQKRLISLWREISRRYKHEKNIIGYGLVNEPVPTASGTQWTMLAQNIINAIRSEDDHHILFVERVNWLKYTESPAEKMNMYFPFVTDPGSKKNIVYEYHMYNPMAFTHQNASWVNSLVGKLSTYPDHNRIETIGEKWEWFTDSNPYASVGTTQWSTLYGKSYPSTNISYKIGKPTVQVQSIGSSGKVWIDDITINEYDSEDNLIKTITTPVNGDDTWYFWSKNNSGRASADNESRASEGKCVSVSGTTDDANIGFDSLRFIVTPNHKYKISGKVKGDNIATGAVIRFRVDFFSCDSIYSWNKNYLQSIINDYIIFSKRNNVPVYLGEFGAIQFAYQSKRGGEKWLGDMLDILKAGNVNYNYHTYHEDNFGIFCNKDSSLPDPNIVNQAAIDLFTKKQKPVQLMKAGQH